jgi:hypothetical protein
MAEKSKKRAIRHCANARSRSPRLNAALKHAAGKPQD